MSARSDYEVALEPTQEKRPIFRDEEDIFVVYASVVDVVVVSGSDFSSCNCTSCQRKRSEFFRKASLLNLQLPHTPRKRLQRRILAHPLVHMNIAEWFAENAVMDCPTATTNRKSSLLWTERRTAIQSGC